MSAAGAVELNRGFRSPAEYKTGPVDTRADLTAPKPDWGTLRFATPAALGFREGGISLDQGVLPQGPTQARDTLGKTRRFFANLSGGLYGVPLPMPSWTLNRPLGDDPSGQTPDAPIPSGYRWVARTDRRGFGVDRQFFPNPTTSHYIATQEALAYARARGGNRRSRWQMRPALGPNRLSSLAIPTSYGSQTPIVQGVASSDAGSFYG